MSRNVLARITFGAGLSKNAFALRSQTQMLDYPGMIGVTCLPELSQNVKGVCNSSRRLFALSEKIAAPEPTG
jgi:hypothetical protein